jgi:hypothetical protein
MLYFLDNKPITEQELQQLLNDLEYQNYPLQCIKLEKVTTNAIYFILLNY